VAALAESFYSLQNNRPATKRFLVLQPMNSIFAENLIGIDDGLILFDSQSGFSLFLLSGKVLYVGANEIMIDRFLYLLIY
jgi:hypothetical protein